jgi:hypothetical protein
LWHQTNAVSDAEPTIKGSPTIKSRDWLDEQLGEGWFLQVIREQAPDWPERMLLGEWYALAPQMHVWHVAQLKLRAKFESVEPMIELAAGITAQDDLTGVHKAFLWASSPRMFLRLVPKIWRTYASFGTVTNVDNEAGAYVARVTEIPKDFMPWATAAFCGFLPPALHLAGAKDAVAEVEQRSRSAGAQTWEFVYRLRYD